MPIIQISEIQFRTGVENDLQPGALKPAEPAMLVDSGRIVVGVDPNHSGPWTDRAVFPYDHVEVLTESSLETFARLFDRFHRTLGPVGIVEGADTFLRRPFLDAALPISANWTPVLVKRVNTATGLLDDGTTEELTLVEGETLGGMIEYFLLGADNVVRTGVLTVVHDGNPSVDAARVVDENVAVPTIVGNGTPILVDDLFVTGVQFRVMRVSAGPGEYRMRLEYKNTTASAYSIQIRAMVSTFVTS